MPNAVTRARHLIDARDWADSPLGPRASWSPALATLVDVMLGSSQPMFVVWGAAQILLYNDPYAEILAGKHPAAMGRPMLQVWHEIASELEPIVSHAYSGEPVHMDDIRLMVERKGHKEEAHFAFSYTPVRGAAERVDGFFCACVEITAQVMADRRRISERERREQMFEQAPGLIAVLDGPDHVFTLANAAYRDLTGNRPLLGRPVRDALPEVAGQGFTELLDRVYATGDRFKGEAVPVLLTRDPNGADQERFVDFVFQPITDGDGRVSGIFIEGADVTERRKAEAALGDRNERLRLIVDGATDYAIMTLDTGLRVTSWSPGAARTFGYLPDEIIGQPADILFTPEDRAADVLAVEAETARRDGRAPDVRWHLRKDGSRVFLDGSCHALQDSAGQDIGFLKIARDETERRRIDEALRTAEERYRLAARATNDAIWDWDLVSDQVTWNDAVQTLFGYRREAIGTSSAWWKKNVHPDDCERVVGSIQAVIDGEGGGWTHEYRFRCADASYAHVLDRGTVIHGEDGRALRMVGAMHDITKRKQAERSLRRLNETLESRVAEEVAMRLRTEDALRQSQKMEAIGQLTGGVAHDFNNLLTVIRGSADILRRMDLTDAKRRRYIDAISDTADRAAKLTGQLLAFARRQALKPEVFDVSERVQRIMDMLRTIVGERVAIVADAPCDRFFVEADAAQFETALVNMAVNARDAMDGEGHLDIAIKRVGALPPAQGQAQVKGAFVAVSVTDTGHGIAANKLDQIFEPFFSTKDVGKGTGLGLSQVYGFAKQSGGEILVESVVGEGTTFTLYFAQAAPSADAEQSAPAVDGAVGGGHILVVEDNEQVGDFATDVLAEMGFETSCAANGEAALKLLDDHPGRYAAVFSDVVMPGMTGLELGREIERRWPDLPVVLTSGYSHVLASDGRHGFELLHKPYSIDELTHVIRRVIGRG